MILSSVIIVLGEVLEAAILTSLFLVLGQHVHHSKKWLMFALVTGMGLAFIYALFFEQLSDLFDGFGQELITASLQLIIYLCLLVFNTLVFIHPQTPHQRQLLRWIMITAVTLTIMREGSEIYLYLYGYYYSDTGIASVLTGSILGIGIGLSVGVLIYYFLFNLKSRTASIIGYSILLLSAAGVLLQAVRLLIQIDYLPSATALWNSSWLINESSVTGRLLNTLIGYEATPSMLEVIFYGSAIAAILLSSYSVQHHFNRSHRYES